MARYTVDALAMLHLLDHDLCPHQDHQLVAPNSVRSEVLQLLLHDVRDGKRAERDALKVHERLTEMKIRLLGDRMSRATAWRIAREHDWDTLREAEYLAVTRLQADALIALDPGLAGRAAGIVPLAPLEVLLGAD